MQKILLLLDWKAEEEPSKPFSHIIFMSSPDTDRGSISIPSILDLPDNSKVQILFIGVQGAVDHLDHRLDLLMAAVKEIQNDCTHKKTEEKRRFDRRYPSSDGLGIDIVESRFCLNCKLVIKRPEGQPHEICHICWNPMTKLNEMPSPGHQPAIAKCTKCGHKVYDT